MKTCKSVLLGLALATAAGTAAAQGKDFDWPALEEEAVTLLSHYLQVDTTNPPGNETRGAEFFKALFDREGIGSRIIESAPDRGNIYARLPGDGSKPAVVLMHHMDVVPADERYWTVDPFSGELKDGYVWGRGALDTKGQGIINAMVLLALKRGGTPLQGDVIFLGVADEEAGGAMGAGFLVERHFDLFENVGVVLNEGGRIAVDEVGAAKYYGVEAAQKIPFWLQLTATGIPGHGSVPRPDSAVNKLIEALHRIANYRTPLRVVPEVQRFFADTAHLEAEPRREKLKDLEAALQDPVFAAEFTANLVKNAQIRNTISVTMLEGSNKTNVIPPQASAQLDIRLLPDQDPQAFLEELKQLIGDESIQIETVLSFPPAASPTDHEFFQVLKELAERHDPGAVVTTPLLVGFTDCHYFRERDIPCYGFWPFRLRDQDFAMFHGNDERLSVENVRFGTRLSYEIVARLAGAQYRTQP